MKYFKSIFIKQNEKPPLIGNDELKTIYDPNQPTVHLDDIKSLIKQEYLRKFLFNRPTTSYLEELKVLYSIHMMLFADQINDIDQIIFALKQGKMIYQKSDVHHQHMQTQIFNRTQGQQQQTIYDLNTSEAPVQIVNFEIELTKLYYSYLQRLSANYDIYQSAKSCTYPYPDDYLNRRIQFLWMFKVINLMNFKLALIPTIQKMVVAQNAYTLVVKDIAALVYKDCVNEYQFLKKELEETLEVYSQFNVKDALSFYELLNQLKYISSNLKLFHNLRAVFIKHEQGKVLNWFKLEKNQEKDLEIYIQKAKIINSQQFRNSLQVPSQKAAYEHLQKIMMQPREQQKEFQLRQLLSPEAFKKKHDSKQNTYRQQRQF